jgi:hypothetical protein
VILVLVGAALLAGIVVAVLWRPWYEQGRRIALGGVLLLVGCGGPLRGAVARLKH